MQPTLVPPIPPGPSRCLTLPVRAYFIDRRPRVVKYLNASLPALLFPSLRLDPLPAPYVLDKSVPLSEAVHGVVGLSHGADEAAEGVDMVLAGDSTAVLVNLGDVDLDGTVVLGLDDAVGGAALAGDVTVGRD